MKMVLTTSAIILATAAMAGEKRSLSAHEHGVSLLNIAVEGGKVAMELEAPGADIVGFEHPAESAEDKAAVEAAKATLSDALSVFVVPEAAGCTLASADVDFITDADDEHGHDDHGHDEHGHDDHDHDDHAEKADDDHDHDHAEAKDADGHDHGHDHDHDDDHAEHAEGGHAEFRAEYAMDCSDPSSLTRIDFAFFEKFPNAEEVEVQMIGEGGTAGTEVTRANPVLEIPGNI